MSTPAQIYSFVNPYVIRTIGVLCADATACKDTFHTAEVFNLFKSKNP